jgi:hypothetical protein
MLSKFYGAINADQSIDAEPEMKDRNIVWDQSEKNLDKDKEIPVPPIHEIYCYQSASCCRQKCVNKRGIFLA